MKIIRMEVMKPIIRQPFDPDIFQHLKTHVENIRKAFDAPGASYHDANAPEHDKFNRFFWRNLPKLLELHHDPLFILDASEAFGLKVKPSYVFLSMYGADG